MNKGDPRVQTHPRVLVTTAKWLNDQAQAIDRPLGYVIDEMVSEFQRQGWQLKRSQRPAIEVAKGGDHAGSPATAMPEEP
jgi:hypothetical protein